ncbi:MAG: cysteine--tRNA ligase [Parcubacteria group bacterium]|nr:cysteine--tRNA ligase [Parcubacteria group bacterium]
MLSLTNTFSGEKEEFKPLHLPKVTMYNCGPTVYDYAHLGNMRSYVLADILKRTLKYEGYEVEQIINITDVGHLVGDIETGKDKVEEKANKTKKTVKEITDFYTADFLEDLEKMNIDTVGTRFPKATDHIKEQIALIKTLEEKSFTYKISDGVYFDTSKFSNYGKLGNINLKGLEEGARVSINTEKKNGTDFALWKFSSVDDNRQQEWDSPWGVGFPGWHIECSAMSMKYLGETIDIHTGGIDHIPVHHNNEIAQSESATGKPFVRYWLHNAFINASGGAKMAKSEGNFLRLQSLLDKHIDPLAYRYWLLMAHYSTPMTFSFEAVEAAGKSLERLKNYVSEYADKNGSLSSEYVKNLKDFIEDDLDTPRIIALAWELVKDDNISGVDKKETLLEFDKILGLDLKSANKKVPVVVPSKVQKLVEEREIARKEKDWDKADELRQKISELGYEVKDTDNGSEISNK